MSTGNPLPPFVVQAGFGSNPFDSPQVWTDITSLVRAIPQMTRGRQHVLSSVQPGRFVLVCDGRGGELDPTNTASPYYPNVDIDKQVRVGVVMNVLTNAQSVLSSGSWTAGANTTLTYATGKVTLTASTTGSVTASTPTGTSGFAVVPGRSYTDIGTFTAGTTARTCTVAVTWFDKTGATISTSTSPGTVDSTGGLAMTFPVTAPANAATGSMTVTVAGCAASEQHTLSKPGLIDWTDPAANYYPGGPLPLFTGFIESVKPQWLSNLGTDIQITATDTLRMAQQTKLPADPAVPWATSRSATAVYPFGDASGSPVAAEVVSGQNGTLVGVATLGGASRSPVIDGTTLSLAGGYVSLPPGVYIDPSTGGAGIALSFACSNVANTPYLYNQQFNFPGIPQSGTISLQLDASGQIVANCAYTNISITGTLTLTSPASYNDGLWHRVFLVASSSTAFTLFVDGVQVASGTASHAIGAGAGTVTVGTSGALGSSSLTGSVSCVALWHTAAFPTGAALASLILSDFQTSTQYWVTPEVSTARIADAAAVAGVPTALVAGAGAGSDAGNSNIAQATSTLTDTPLLSYLQEVELAENGFLFARTDGVIVLYDRHHYVNPATPAVTFGDNPSAGEIPYKPGPDVGLDNIDLYNRSTASSTLTNNTQVAQDGTSQSKYRIVRSLDEPGLLITNDAEALARSQWNVARYANPITRAGSVTVDVLAQAASNVVQQLLLNQPNQGIELGALATLKRRPWSRSGGFSGWTFSQLSMIEGVDHSISLSPATWRMTVHLSPVDVQPYWVLGTSALGTNTRLAY